MVEKRASTTKSQLILGFTVYILTGILQPIVIDYLRLSSLLGHKFLLLPTFANAIGMTICGFLVSSKKWAVFFSVLRRQRQHDEEETIPLSLTTTQQPENIITTRNISRNLPSLKQMILVTAFVDLISGMFLTLGILLTGGAIFVVLYNSCPVWTALISRVFLKKYLNWIQMTGILLVCVALILNVLGSQLQLTTSSDSEGGGGSGATKTFKPHLVVVGSIIVLVGSLLHSLMFVLSDFSMSMVRNQTESFMTGEMWACCIGSLEACFMIVWVSIGILLFGFNEHSTAEDVSSTFSNFWASLIGLGWLILIDTIHAAAFFTLLQNVGAVASALMKGVQCLVVIVFSALFYCPTEKSQCLTGSKIFSAILVLMGVLGYGIGRSANNNPKQQTKNMMCIRDETTL